MEGNFPANFRANKTPLGLVNIPSARHRPGSMGGVSPQGTLAPRHTARQSLQTVLMRKSLPQLKFNASARGAEGPARQRLAVTLASWKLALLPGRGWLRLGRALVCLALFVWLAPAGLLAATFTATLDRETVTVGESATLSLTFEGGQPKAMPNLPPIPNLQITGRGSSKSVDLVSGQVTALSQTLVLTPTEAGEFPIPALQAEINGQIVASRPLKLKVLKPGATVTSQPGERLAFMKLLVPKKEIFAGEAFAVELQVYIRDGVANGDYILQQFEAFPEPSVNVEGFSLLKTVHAQRRRAQFGNATYSFTTLVTSLSPVKTGPLTVSPASKLEITLPLQIPLPNQRRRDPFFDPFGMFQQFEEKRVALAAAPETVTVLPLPKENIPSNFNGAVGNFSMTVSAGPTNIAVGDLITVKIQISGHGAFDSLALPDQPAWRDFKTYPPTSKMDTTDPLGLQGSKTFEQVIIPQSTEIKELSPVSFSFFDPEQKSYRTLTQPSVKLVVRPGAASAAPTVVSATPAPPESQPSAQDIVHIKPRLGMVAQISPPLLQQPWFLALQAVPLFALAAAVVWRKRADNFANNPRLRRQRQVAQIIREGLDELRRLASENNSDEFFATLFHLLQEQLGERLDLPASAITEAVIEEQLRPRGVAETVLAPLHELFQACNLARYAPIKTSQELTAIIPKVEVVLRQLQEVRV